MKNLLFGTSGSGWAPLFARLALGLIMLPHGLQKTLGLFGGMGFDKTLSMFTHGMHIPQHLAIIAILTESIGAAGLILGFLTRVWAVGFIVLMSVAIHTAHWSNGLFMNWAGNQKGEGYEFHLLVIGLALSLLISGAGKLSVDSALAGKKSAPKEKE